MTFHDRLFRLWRFVTNTSAAAFVLLVVGVASAALAQEVIPPVPLSEDPIKAVTGAAEAVAKGQWWVAAAAVVSLLTWGLRSGILLKLPKTGALAFLGKGGTWLAENPIASFVTPFALSALLGSITTFANGTPFSFQTFLQEALKIGAGAVALFIGKEKILEAKNAGKLEAAGVTTQQDALDELAKRVVAAPTAPPPPSRVILPPE